MKAVVAMSYGGPEVFSIQEVVQPIPKPNEVLVKVKASDVSRAGAMMRTGKPYFGRLFMGLTKPKNAIPGTGFAGEIVGLGSQATKYKVGDRVFGENITSFGTNAEFVCVAEDGVLAILPDKMTFEEGAPLCDGALTSMNFLKLIGNIKPGMKVLINGASGGLGTAAVQLAKYYGAHVTAVCSTNNVELVRNLGADVVIDYTKQDFTETFQVFGIIYDTVGKSSFSKCKHSLTKNGIYMSPVLGMSLLCDVLFSSIFGKKKAKFSATGVLPVPKLREMLHELTEIIEMGYLSSVIDKSYPLHHIQAAHQYVDKGHKRGSLVLV